MTPLNRCDSLPQISYQECSLISVLLNLLKTSSDSKFSHDILLIAQENGCLEDLLDSIRHISILINKMDSNNNSILHIAAWNGQTLLMNMLLQYFYHRINDSYRLPGIINAINSDLQLPIHLAIKQRHYETAQILLEMGADIDHQDINGETAKDILKKHQSYLSPLEKTDQLSIFKVSSFPSLTGEREIRYIQESQPHQNLLVNPASIKQEPYSLSTLDLDKKATEHLLNLESKDFEDRQVRYQKKYTNNPTSILRSAQKGYDELKCTILKGFDINVSTGNGNTALMMAADKGDIKAVKVLIKHNVDASRINSRRKSALNIALSHVSDCMRGRNLAHKEKKKQAYKTIALKLAAYDPSVAAIIDEGNRSPLKIAQIHQLHEIREILERGAQDKIPTPHSHLPVLIETRPRKILPNEIHKIDKERISKIIIKEAPVNKKKLVKACCSGKYATLNAWITSENVNYKTRLYTLLELTAKSGHIECMELLLERGADPNTFCKSSALHIAASRDDRNMIKLLLRYEANINILNRRKQTPIFLAASQGNKKALKILMKNKADATIKSSDQKTPLDALLRRRYGSLSIKLFNYEPSVINETNKQGNTPLHSAAIYGILSIAKILLNNGANPQIPNNEGKTALNLARSKKHQKIINLFYRWIRKHKTLELPSELENNHEGNATDTDFGKKSS